MQKNLIVSDPTVMMGKPVIAGTRITVEFILEKLASGETIDQILEAHPRLSHEGIHAALAYAVDVLKCDVVYPAAGEVARIYSLIKALTDRLLLRGAFSVITRWAFVFEVKTMNYPAASYGVSDVMPDLPALVRLPGK